MKGLVGVVNKEEALRAIAGGVDIIHIENPGEGTFGANFPWIIQEIKEVIPKNLEWSIAVGDVPNLPGTVSLAVAGAAQYSPNYIKIGLKGPKTKQEAINLIKKAVRSAKSINENIKVIVAGYADYKEFNTINPMHLPKIASRAGADGAKIDTIKKKGKSLLDLISLEELGKFVKSCHKKNLEAHLAGSLTKDQIKLIAKTGVDVIAVRGMVCNKKDRRLNLEEKLVKEFMEELRSY